MHQKIRFSLLVVALIAMMPSLSHGGNAAVHPVVDGTLGCLMGGVSNGAWLLPEDAAKQLRGKVPVRTVTVSGRTGRAVAGKPVESEDPPFEGVYAVPLQQKKDLQEDFFAIGGDWDLLPRKVRRIKTLPERNERALVVFLREKHLAKKMLVEQSLLVDLDGDGKDEIVIAARNRGRAMSGVMHANDGDYSVIAVQKESGDEVLTVLVTGDVEPRERGDATAYYFTIAGIFDFDGDGKMEIAVRRRYYEGNSITIYRLDKHVPVSIAGCGYDV